MSKFFVQYHSRTLAALSGREQQQNIPLPAWKFNLPNASVALRDLVNRIRDINLHYGLDLIIEVEADSDKDAISLSRNHCETLLNLVTFSTLAFCHPGKLVNMIKFEPEELPLFRFYIYPFDEKFGSPVLVDEGKFRKIYDAFYNQSDIESKQRVMRALTWHRKGINEEEPVDEFIAYWVGLEVIKCRLRRWLKNSGQMKEPDEWDGLKYVFERILGYTNFEEIKNARNSLLHGFRELSFDYVNEIVGYVEPTRRALIASIATILGLDSEIRDFIVSKDIRRVAEYWHVIEGDVEELPDDFDSLVFSYPKIEIEIPDTNTYKFDNEGNLNVGGSYKIRFLGVPKAVWHVKAGESWGGRNSGIKKASIDIRKPNENV